jgi:hypothetical protein
MKTSLKALITPLLLALLFTGSAIADPTVQLGPDTVPDIPVGPGPFVFSNAIGGYGYQLQIASNPTSGWEWHVPVFTLTNTSTNPWADILSFRFTIGDTAYNFDHLGVQNRDPLPSFTTDLNADGAYGWATPDHVDASVRSDDVQFLQFTGFDPGDVFTFMSDIDADSIGGGVGTVEDFRNVFWNNGDNPNSEITVTYAVPAPGTIVLAILGLSAAGVKLRKRRA